MGTAYALGTLRPQDTLAQDTSALNYSAELSGHFGIDLYETLRHHNTLTGHNKIPTYIVFLTYFNDCDHS